MTEKQIKRMIRKEGVSFLPVRNTCRYYSRYHICIFIRAEWNNDYQCHSHKIFAIILGIIIVQISVYKPAQIASNISPIEATKYVGNDPELKESRVRNRKNHIRLSPYSLAVLSEKQNRKKTQSDDCLACNRRDFYLWLEPLLYHHGIQIPLREWGIWKMENIILRLTTIH